MKRRRRGLRPAATAATSRSSAFASFAIAAWRTRSFSSSYFGASRARPSRTATLPIRNVPFVWRTNAGISPWTCTEVSSMCIASTHRAPGSAWHTSERHSRAKSRQFAIVQGRPWASVAGASSGIVLSFACTSFTGGPPVNSTDMPRFAGFPPRFLLSIRVAI